MSSPSFLRRLFWSLARLRNQVDFPLRRAIALRRRGLSFRNQPKGGLYDYLPAEQRKEALSLAARLRRDYHLDDFYAASTALNYRENLYYLHLLEQAFLRSDLELPAPVTVADIGPSHWFYVQALYAFLRWQRSPAGREVDLTAYEIDAYRVYTDLYSRYDHALAHMRSLPGTRYLAQAFTAQPGHFHLVLALFPFIFEGDHLEWGLPHALFAPRRLQQQAWDSLSPGGVLVIVNQGLEEHQAQQALLQEIDVQPVAAYQHVSTLYDYDLPRYVLVSRHA